MFFPNWPVDSKPFQVKHYPPSPLPSPSQGGGVYLTGWCESVDTRAKGPDVLWSKVLEKQTFTNFILTCRKMSDLWPAHCGDHVFLESLTHITQRKYFEDRGKQKESPYSKTLTSYEQFCWQKEFPPNIYAAPHLVEHCSPGLTLKMWASWVVAASRPL